MTREEAKDYIREWCPYDRQEEIIKALEQEPCDCISREEVYDYIAEFVNHEYATDREREMIKHIIGGIQHLPSIQPKAKMGHWIEKDGFDGDTYYDCSECGESWTTIEGTPWNNGMKYCPNCGAKMESEE